MTCFQDVWAIAKDLRHFELASALLHGTNKRQGPNGLPYRKNSIPHNDWAAFSFTIRFK